MRSYVVMYTVWNAREYHTGKTVNIKWVFSVDWYPGLETYKIRDRLGVNPSPVGDGPFFGANISPYARLNVVSKYQGYDCCGAGAIGPLGDYNGWSGAYMYFDGVCFVEIRRSKGGKILYDDAPSNQAHGKVYARDPHNQRWTGAVGFNLWSWPNELITMSNQEIVAYVKRVVMSDMLNPRRSSRDGILSCFDLSRSSITVVPGTRWWYKSQLTVISGSELIAPSVDSLKYQEWLVAESAAEGMASNMFYSGCASAFDAALDALPDITVNSAANLIELVSMGIDLFRGISNIPKTASDAWLAYRYQYSTSKADLAEYVALTNRLIDLVHDQPDEIPSYGVFYDGDFQYHCVLKFSPSSILPKNAREWLEHYGFKVNAVNYWDMIPYSFVVDWFLNIGDILQYVENLGRAIAYRNTECWYSVTTRYTGVNTYCRLPGSVVPRFPPRITFKGVKKKTLIKRFIDGACLIGGK